MSQKTVIMFGMTVGSLLGGWLPTLFGISGLSFTALLTGGAGGVLGIVLAYRLTR